ncbi:SMC-Scp complex subunit ScpB [Parashewanella spongiae]|uniref:SMC-Scp complex subunit ScpB n=1 Tax=Parashewanella spongiae TaxID=342950 RepID=A0A3A6U218_9GAMM|nr:SMC-Scp complex subunit ScpB [Parashewanella spongiae]MCL1076734.1 SMC-Scp complex subunit ScpB [Parashewanella spongiae]RJY19475.1 SMC-Scp complex subunit ScpB [Parashewanella spongiae]
MQINDIQLKQLIEASLFVLDKPQTMTQMKDSFLSNFSVSKDRIKAVISELEQDYQERGVQLVQVAGGYRFQTAEFLSPLLQSLWQEKAPKYSRATLETLAVIAYQQPVTRGDVEQVRGVTVSSHIIKTLSDRSWIKVVGHKEVPGRPALYSTTNDFLDYFGLRNLSELPQLSDPESLQALFSVSELVPDIKEESTNE